MAALLDMATTGSRTPDLAEVAEGHDRRAAGLGVLLCAASDAHTRLRLLECTTPGSFQPLRGMPPGTDLQGCGAWADAELPEPDGTVPAALG